MMSSRLAVALAISSVVATLAPEGTTAGDVHIPVSRAPRASEEDITALREQRKLRKHTNFLKRQPKK